MLSSRKITTKWYPFGMLAQNYNAKSYRFGFQNQEKDDEIYGIGNSINFKYRVTDTRLGRFWSVDPLASKYPHNSTYAFSENRVIDGIELEGLEWKAVKDENIGKYTGFEWDPENAWTTNDKGEKVLKEGYYETAILFKDNGTYKKGIYESKKYGARRLMNYNIGSSDVLVYKKEGTIKHYKGASLPSDLEKFATVKSGILLEAKVGLHKGYKALNLYNTNGTRRIPVEGGVNPAHPNQYDPNIGGGYAIGVDIHYAGKGNFTGTFYKTINGKERYCGVSEGCLLIDRSKWYDFMSNFKPKTKIGVIVAR